MYGEKNPLDRERAGGAGGGVPVFVGEFFARQGDFANPRAGIYNI